MDEKENKLGGDEGGGAEGGGAEGGGAEGGGAECGGTEGGGTEGGGDEGGGAEGSGAEGGGAEGGGAEGGGAEGGGAEGGDAEGGGAEANGAEGGGAESGGAEAKVGSDKAEVGAAIGGDDITTVAGKLSDLHLESISVHRETRHPEIDLSGIVRGFADVLLFEDHITHINLSKNELKVVPKALLALKNIVNLNLSKNLIEYFNEAPMFVNTIEDLSLAYNSLMAPPLWIWRDTPAKLKCLNISENENVFITLKNRMPIEYYHCWLNIFKIVMFNCRVHICNDVLYTLSGVHELYLGGGDTTGNRSNELYEFPTESLCCVEARIINVNHCKIYNINCAILCYSSVKYIDFGMNLISYLPDELCELQELEVLILSSNKLDCLPDKMVELKKLEVLLIGENKIEKLPDNLLNALPQLKCLDLYNNCFNTIPDGHQNLYEFDIAQNFIIEPVHPEYVQMRTELRANHPSEYDRKNGNKIRPVLVEEYEDSESEDETNDDNAGAVLRQLPASKGKWETDAPNAKSAKGKP